jgi:hypothetical protein
MMRPHRRWSCFEICTSYLWFCAPLQLILKGPVEAQASEAFRHKKLSCKRLFTNNNW